MVEPYFQLVMGVRAWMYSDLGKLLEEMGGGRGVDGSYPIATTHSLFWKRREAGGGGARAMSIWVALAATSSSVAAWSTSGMHPTDGGGSTGGG